LLLSIIDLAAQRRIKGNFIKESRALGVEVPLP
jgi:hypothetical protein